MAILAPLRPNTDDQAPRCGRCHGRDSRRTPVNTTLQSPRQNHMRLELTIVLRALLVAALAIPLAAPGLLAQRGGGRGTAIGPGQSCLPSTTEIRPRNCMGPEAP